MEETEQTLRSLRLAEQAILKESLETQALQIKELKSEVIYLRRTLNDAFTVPRAALAVQRTGTASRNAPLPRRWKA
jgi:hypothetical protein